MTKVKVGYLISYDYNYFFKSVQYVYDFVDEIILAIDKDRLTWSGAIFNIDSSFFDMVKKIDTSNKITIYENTFYIKGNTPMENETNERNLLSKKMGENCWKLQIDSDEYFINFEKLIKILKANNYFLSKPQFNPINIRGKWITLFKKTDNGFLYIDNFENFSFGTNLVNRYDFARNINCPEIIGDFYAIHQSWARTEDEIKQKISNWGHKNDFDVDSFFQFWLTLNENNYVNHENFHPLYPKEWKKLEFIECNSLEDFILKYRQQNKDKLLSKTKINNKYYIKYLRNFFR